METKIEEIKNKIESTIEKRREIFKKIKYRIYNCHLHNYRDYYVRRYYPDFLDFLAYKLNFNKKQKKQYRKEFYKLGKGSSQDSGLCKLPHEKWTKLEIHLKNMLKYQDEFIIQKEKKELKRLTQCLQKLDNSNPCKITCKECGYENEIEANFCSQCSEAVK